MNTRLRRFAGGLLFLALPATPLVAAPPDVLPWRRYEEPQFPASLLSTPVRDGFARVAFTFDDSGNITDQIVITASHPAFAVAVLEASRLWTIDAERLGVAVRREVLEYNFFRDRAVVRMGQRDANRALFTLSLDEPEMTVPTITEAEAESPLQTINRVVPEFPPELKARGVRGAAVVSFVVDPEGRVRVPAVTYATEAEFGEALLAAIRQWRFERPKQGKLPVQVYVERAFKFTPRQTVE